MNRMKELPVLCNGNSQDHCCYLNGKVCVFLEEWTVPDRHWACGLYRELGSWELVHRDTRYQKHIQPFWDTHGPRMGVYSCGEFPGPNKCESCGKQGKHD